VVDVRTWRVPGRVNLIGEHLDYNGGPCLPFAIDRGLVVKARPRDDDTVTVWSEGRTATFAISDSPSDVEPWALHVAGTVSLLAAAGHTIRGADLVIESDLPAGAGLASSAALTCGVAHALGDLSGLGLSALNVALVSQKVENDVIGAPTGLMDQLAVLHGRAGHAVVVQALADPPTVREVPLALDESGLSLLVLATGVAHQHAESGYGARREESQRAAATLGLDHLADAGPDAVLRLDDPTLKSRTRHVITETARVRGAVRALEAGAWAQLGTMLTASHESLRDDYEVSCAELDVTVEAAVEAGALGARMTGGGFGGSAIALVPDDRVGAVRELVGRRFESVGWRQPDVFAVHATDGLALVEHAG
jgi:galactokinase